MGGKGRPPKPTKLKVLQGTDRKDRMNENEPKPIEIKKLPEPPWHLDYYAKKEWERAGPYLIESGLLTHVDLSMFQDYCAMHAHCIRLNKKIRKEGYDFTTETGYMQRVPATTILKDFMAEKQKLANMLGLSPSARTKIEIEKPDNNNKTRKEILNSDVS